jgi:anaerobic selenocysteine-containing dehydrogenase
MATASSRPPTVAHNSSPILSAPPEQRDAHFPLTLITGRLRDQWHGMSRTGTAAQLFGHVAKRLSLHPDELRQHACSQAILSA